MSGMMVAVVAVFSYHVLLGWRTGIVRFPMSILAMQEFDRARSPANFWGIMMLDIFCAVVAFVAAFHFITIAVA
ncbi:hypothetical protein [uncultured Sphingomonas sp.]|uniref:hypothetical protein n=1 Tax=uncultured Sphingomonas sp. TaxID=158754 RepID=UPI0025EF6A29|nr:hypothetical protein [uncultured Sphingomonas sp.]